MGKELEANQHSHRTAAPPIKSPKIIKLGYKIDKMKHLTKDSLFKSEQEPSPPIFQEPRSKFVVGGKELTLSLPQNSPFVTESVSESSLNALHRDNSAKEIRSDKNSANGQMNSITRDSMMNLNESELKYLKSIVVDKYKDENMDKLHRSKRRYGW